MPYTNFLFYLVPRLGACIYVIVIATYIESESKWHYEPIGTAFAITSQSNNLLLTAAHIISQPHNTGMTIGLIKSLLKLINNEVKSDPTDFIEVTCIHIDNKSDTAILQTRVSTAPFQHTIPLCPTHKMPTTLHEDSVKAYYCPCEMYKRNEIPALSFIATIYYKILIETATHYYLTSKCMSGSSAGGVVVDRLGRAVAIIVSEYTPMLSMPHTSAAAHESDSSQARSTVGTGGAALTKCIRLDQCTGLSDILHLLQ